MDPHEVGEIVRKQMVELKPLLNGIMQELSIRNTNMRDGGLAFLFMAAAAIVAFHAKSGNEFTTEHQDEMLEIFRHMLMYTWEMEVQNRGRI